MILMGKKIKLFSKRIIIRLFQFLGISSLLTAFGCGSRGPFIAMYGVEPVDMYGTPSNYFILDGTVTDSNGDPIQGIKITAKGKHEDAPSDVFTSNFSNEKGYYRLRWNDSNRNDMSFYITAEDVDGEENGSFNDTTITIDFSKTPKTKNYTITGKNIKLDEKKEE